MSTFVQIEYNEVWKLCPSPLKKCVWMCKRSLLYTCVCVRLCIKFSYAINRITNPKFVEARSQKLIRIKTHHVSNEIQYGSLPIINSIEQKGVCVSSEGMRKTIIWVVSCLFLRPVNDRNRWFVLLNRNILDYQNIRSMSRRNGSTLVTRKSRSYDPICHDKISCRYCVANNCVTMLQYRVRRSGLLFFTKKPKQKLQI